MESLYVWRYTLRSRQGLNAASAKTCHEGALIRLEEGGVGCVHPWPELGDAALPDQLLALSGRRAQTRITEAALHCARMDGEARRRGVSLFQNPIPESHWLVLAGDDAEKAREKGFRIAKMKCGPRKAEAELLVRRMEEWLDAGFWIRLDANESFASGTFLEFWETLGERLGEEKRRKVDFVEDPEAWSEEAWDILRRAGVPIAADRDQEERWRAGDVRICKPGRGDRIGAENVGGKEARAFCFTSYMDHAIGQMWAAACAAVMIESPDAGRLLTCGLLTQRCFEPDAFFERLTCEGARLLPPEGTGLGFDDLIDSLPWTRLC